MAQASGRCLSTHPDCQPQSLSCHFPQKAWKSSSLTQCASLISNFFHFFPETYLRFEIPSLFLRIIWISVCARVILVCMYVCGHTCVLVCICVYTCVYVCGHMWVFVCNVCTYMCACVYVYLPKFFFFFFLQVYVCTRVCACGSLCVHISASLFTCVYVYTCVCLCVCVHIYACLFTGVCINMCVCLFLSVCVCCGMLSFMCDLPVAFLNCRQL